MLFTIYKHTNSLNGKCYIGKTKFTLEKRWQNHVNTAIKGHKSHFANAIRSLSLDSWVHEILEVVNTHEEANSCEIKWIKHYQSNLPSLGYNMTQGGDGGRTCDPSVLSEKFRTVPKSDEHKQHMRESQEQYWNDHPEDPRRKQLADRNRSQEGIEASRQAQLRRWGKPDAKEAMKLAWQDPVWRANMLEARRLARLKRKEAIVSCSAI